MSTAAAGRRRFPGWLWPSGLPAPGSFREAAAGGVVLRCPSPEADVGLADLLMASLRRASVRLASLPVAEIAATLGAAAGDFVRELDDVAIRDIAANAVLSPAMTREVVKRMARSWTPQALQRLVEAEFPNPRVLDAFVREGDGSRAVRASGSGVTLVVGAGTVPGVAVSSLIRGLLVKSAVLLKPGAGDVVLTTRFVRSLLAADPLLGAAAAIQYWPGGDPAHDRWERALLRLADQAVVYGSNATIEAIRSRTPASTRLAEHPHRLGVAVVDPVRAPNSPAHAAQAVALFDQRGCVSTHIVFLLGDRDRAARWCQDLAARLDALHATLPPPAPDPNAASALHQLRGRLAIRKAASQDVRVWASEGPGWTVVLAPTELFEPTGLRTAWVVSVPNLETCVEALATLGPVLQTVGAAGVSLDANTADALFAAGASRIVPLEEVPFPASDWLHDGNRPLGELVRWSELVEPG